MASERENRRAGDRPRTERLRLVGGAVVDFSTGPPGRSVLRTSIRPGDPNGQPRFRRGRRPQDSLHPNVGGQQHNRAQPVLERAGQIMDVAAGPARGLDGDSGVVAPLGVKRTSPVSLASGPTSRKVRAPLRYIASTCDHELDRPRRAGRPASHSRLDIVRIRPGGRVGEDRDRRSPRSSPATTASRNGPSSLRRRTGCGTPPRPGTTRIVICRSAQDPASPLDLTRPIRRGRIAGAHSCWR